MQACPEEYWAGALNYLFYLPCDLYFSEKVCRVYTGAMLSQKQGIVRFNVHGSCEKSLSIESKKNVHLEVGVTILHNDLI